MIRKMRENDYQAVKELFFESHNLHLKNRPDIYKDGDCLPKKTFNDFLTNYDDLNYVYIKDKKVVGVLIASLKYTLDNSILKGQKICFIENIVVHKDNKRERIGRSMYEFLKEEIKDTGVDAIELNAWGFNKEAIKFYESLGMSIKNIRYEDKI